VYFPCTAPYSLSFIPCLQESLTIVNSRVKVRFIHGHTNPLDYDKIGNNLVCGKQRRKRSHVVLETILCLEVFHLFSFQMTKQGHQRYNTYCNRALAPHKVLVHLDSPELPIVFTNLPQ